MAGANKVMRYKILFSGLLFCIEFLAFVSLSCAASGSQKLKIMYSSLNGAYAPFWIAVEEGLGRKYGLDLEAIYGGRTPANLMLASGETLHVHPSEISHWLLLEQKSPMNNYLKQYDPLCALRVSPPS